MNPSQEIISRFYKAFQQRDWQTMQQCYHPEAHFSDPAFPNLKGNEVKAMWHMLCENAQDFSLQFSDIMANNDQGSSNWQAWYIFSRTGRKVHNVIHAEFRFKDGLIIEHIDTFNFWRWSRFALGMTGILLGWTPFLQNKVQITAQKSLQRFMSQRPHYST
jgi:ketosteroid isomerase-like protein